MIRNNYVFKGHKALLGGRYVTYGEVELPLRYEQYPKSKNGFDWGVNGSGSLQLAFSMLCQISNEDVAKKYAPDFVKDIIMNLNPRDWIMSASDVQKWIEKNIPTDEINHKKIANNISNLNIKKSKHKKNKNNVVKKVCKELGITQKELANILEVPEGTISSWAVKDEIPRLGKKAIEFYMQNVKNQKIVDSYKNFVKLLDVS